MKPPLTYKPRCAAGHLTSDLRSLTSGHCRGFTLIELLAVIVLMAMLGAILLGAAQYVIKTARVRRAEATAASLQAAITTYRHEYGKWPIPGDDSTLLEALTLISNGSATTNNHAQWTVCKRDDIGIYITFSNTANYLVFDLLRATTNTVAAGTAGPNVDNPKNFPFIDDSTVFSLDTSGQRTRRDLLPHDTDGLVPAGPGHRHSIVYMTRDGATAYYGVTIYLEQEKATVSQ